METENQEGNRLTPMAVKTLCVCVCVHYGSLENEYWDNKSNVWLLHIRYFGVC